MFVEMALGKCWFIVLLFCVCHCYGDQTCTFPDFVQSSAGDPMYPWSASSPDRVYAFKENNMTEASVEWGIVSDEATIYTCAKIVNKDEHIYQISYSTNSTQCIKFTPHTANVVRLSYATADLDGSCPGPWHTEDSVLVRLNTPTAVPSGGCGALEGGFLFRSDDVTHPKVTKPACKHPLPGRLESECLPGEGVRLSYPDIKCVPSGTGWTTDQRLTCLESWTDGDYTFTLLGGDSADQVQCMRTIKDPHSFEIFRGTVCPAAAIEAEIQYTNFTIEARPDFSVCKDYDGCTKQFCTKYGEYCRDMCHLCAKPEICDFEDVVTTGTWLDAASNNTVDISKSEIVFADNMYANLTCRKMVDPASYILQPAVQNTCRPRYTCGKFLRVSPPVLRYKLSQSLFDDTSDITACREGQFSDDPLPVGDTYRSRLYKNLIATDKALLNQTSTCALKGNFSISGSMMDEQCNGSISALNVCEASESMDLNTNNCSFNGEINCLGEIPSDSFETKMMIVIPPHGYATCWVIKGDQRDTVTITSLYPAQCNEDTPNKIQLDPTYHLAGRVKGNREDECDPKPPPPPTTPSTTAEPTTASPTSAETTSSSAPVTTTQPNSTSAEPDTSPTTNTVTTTTELTSEATSTQTTAVPPPTPSPGMSGGTVAAIVISVLILSALLAALLYYIYKKYHRHRVPYNSLT